MVDGLSTIIREFTSLMDSGFRCYEELRTRFFALLPEHWSNGQSSVLEAEINKHLFNETFCAAIPENLKSLRRLLIRLEDLPPPDAHQQHHQVMLASILNAAELKSLAERLEALLQRHWELHRYGSSQKHQSLQLLLDAQQISEAWMRYLSAFNAASSTLQALEAPSCPPHTRKLELRHFHPLPLDAQRLQTLLRFLHASHQFICAVSGAEPLPLTILCIRAGQPLTLELAIPDHTAQDYLRLLQHLFLKDMLKQDVLLKVVFQSVLKEHQGRSSLSPQQLKALEKSLLTALKELPSEGEFHISGRKFPQDNILVLQELTNFLKERDISFKNLLSKPSSSRKKNPPLPAFVPPPDPPPESAASPAASSEASRTERINRLTEITAK